MINETNLTRLIMLAVGKTKNIRLFRNNVGTGWQGKPTWLPNGDLLLKHPRPLQAGLCEGSSDLIGWTMKTITPEMVGQNIAVFTAVEVKKSIKSTASKSQIQFLTVIRNMGGFSGFARSTEEARRLLGVEVKEE